MLGFLLCTPILALALLSVNSAMGTDLVEQDEVPVKHTWSCPLGWSTYQRGTKRSCMFLSAERNKYPHAKSKCRDMGGFLVTLEDEDKLDFATKLKRMAHVDDDVWIGLYKEKGFNSPLKWQGRKSVVVTGLELNNRLRPWTLEHCGYITTNYMGIYGCENLYNWICEREVTCTPGYYGHKCERKCHCLRELCEQEHLKGPESVACKYGCQTNWTGVACDIKIEDPKVAYYCINSAKDNDTYVYIGIYTKGVQYRSVYGLTSEKVRGEWCNSTVIESHSSSMTSIRIPVNNISIDQMSNGECAGQQVGPDTFSWSIVLKEYGGYLQEMDAQFKITCDFSVANNMVHSAKFSFGREHILVEENVIGPVFLQDDVLLQITDSTTGRSTTKAVIGTQVILEMKYALQPGSLLFGVRPHNCVVYTQDEKHLQQLLDENGCQVPNSPVAPFRSEEDNRVRTPWFKVFTFENETSVTFRCEVDICFTSDCKVGCHQKSRKPRDTADLTDQVVHFTTRTIRVLPSIPAKGDGQDQDYQPARPPAAQ